MAIGCAHEEAVQYEGENLYADVLAPRLDAGRGLIAPLRRNTAATAGKMPVVERLVGSTSGP